MTCQNDKTSENFKNFLIGAFDIKSLKQIELT